MGQWSLEGDLCVQKMTASLHLCSCIVSCILGRLFHTFHTLLWGVSDIIISYEEIKSNSFQSRLARLFELVFRLGPHAFVAPESACTASCYLHVSILAFSGWTTSWIGVASQAWRSDQHCSLHPYCSFFNRKLMPCQIDTQLLLLDSRFIGSCTKREVYHQSS